METSPQLTFLAPFLLQIHPQARFIHLTRHPYAVIRSGMRRGWYMGHPADATRLTPPPEDPFYTQWRDLPAIIKIAWIWAETNRWIISFLAKVPPHQQLTLRAESLFVGEEETLRALYRFVNAPMPAERKIRKILGRKLNAQKTGNFPPPDHWDSAQREQIWQWVGPVATSLGYAP